MNRANGADRGPFENPRQIRRGSAFSPRRLPQEPLLDGRRTAEGDAGGGRVAQLRRILLVGIEDPGLKARGLRVEEVSLADLRTEVAASPQGAVAVLGKSVVDAVSTNDLSELLCRPLCIPIA